MPDDAPPPRVHSKWPGNWTFACQGTIVAGPTPRAAFFTLALIVAPSIVFDVLVCWKTLRVKMGLWTVIVSVALQSCSCFWLLKTSFTDPGILPRLPRESGTSGMRGKTKRATVETTGRETTVKWNDTCGYFQPPRAHHCSVCNDCVERFDHHCPWTGTTIGRRNYRAFLSFTFGTAALCAWTCVGCGYAISYESRGGEATDGLKRSGAAIAVFLIAIVGFLFVGALSCFHAYLVSTNQTTYESFRDAHSWSTNQYNTGSVFKNCLEVWCARIGPPRVRFNVPVSEDQSAARFQAEIEAQTDVERGDVQLTDLTAGSTSKT